MAHHLVQLAVTACYLSRANRGLLERTRQAYVPVVASNLSRRPPPRITRAQVSSVLQQHAANVGAAQTRCVHQGGSPFRAAFVHVGSAIEEQLEYVGARARLDTKNQGGLAEVRRDKIEG